MLPFSWRFVRAIKKNNQDTIFWGLVGQGKASKGRETSKEGKENADVVEAEAEG